MNFSRIPFWWLVSAVAFLCGLHVWLAASASSRLGPTADEPVHLTAGTAYWSAGDFRLQPENGNFPQRWMSVPLAWSAVNYPTLDSPAGRSADVWALSREFLFQSGNDLPAMLARSRLMIALLGGVLALTVFLAAKSLFGWTGGFIALLLAVFCPNLLAHGGLATSDTAAALGFLLATLAWWRLCHRVTPCRILLAGAATGLLALSKFSAPLFAPIALTSAAVRLLQPTPLPVELFGFRRFVRGLGRLGALAGAGIVSASFAVLLIWAAFDFRFSANPQAGESVFVKTWDDVLMTTPRVGNSTMADGKPGPDPYLLAPGPVEHFVIWAREHQLLPEAYLYGLAFTDRNARGRLGYFAGDFRETGWVAFFPVAFLLKTTLPALGLMLLATAALRRAPRFRPLLYRLTPLLALLLVYGGYSLTSRLNIGHRHILPLYPVLYIAAGAVGLALLDAHRRRWLAATVAGCLVWHTTDALIIRPHYLTFFNAMAGGPAAGHRWFVDSSLDWGQGLPDLKTWLDANRRDEPLYLSYFGSDDPRRLGLTGTRLGDVYFDFSNRPLLPTLGPGLYCISATMLHRVYTTVRGPWSASYEDAYRRQNDWLASENGARKLDEAGQPLSAAAYEGRVFDLEQLRFGRLTRFLETRSPDAIVANHFFIFRLSAADLTAALQAPVPVGP